MWWEKLKSYGKKLTQSLVSLLLASHHPRQIGSYILKTLPLAQIVTDWENDGEPRMSNIFADYTMDTNVFQVQVAFQMPIATLPYFPAEKRCKRFRKVETLDVLRPRSSDRFC